MSIKSTRRIKRERAIEILTEDLPNLPNDYLAKMLDHLADSELSHIISKFDNFIVTEFTEEDD